MSKDLLSIKFCFPQIDSFTGTINASSYSKLVLEDMQRDGSANYNGYISNKKFSENLQNRVTGLNQSNYRELASIEAEKINRLLNRSVELSSTLLDHPEKPLFVFVFPWFPNSDDMISFGGVTATAMHSRVFHVFINLEGYNDEALVDTVVHEYNHLLYYTKFGLGPFTLKENIVMEGLAEVFKEEVLGTKPSPWAVALSKNEALELYESLTGDLDNKDPKLTLGILFGNEKYKRWSGYSMGYWLAKEFRDQNPKMTWNAIMEFEHKKI